MSRGGTGGSPCCLPFGRRQEADLLKRCLMECGTTAKKTGKEERIFYITNAYLTADFIRNM
jgi:hypothetical protein